MFIKKLGLFALGLAATGFEAATQGTIALSRAMSTVISGTSKSAGTYYHFASLEAISSILETMALKPGTPSTNPAQRDWAQPEGYVYAFTKGMPSGFFCLPRPCTEDGGHISWEEYFQGKAVLVFDSEAIPAYTGMEGLNQQISWVGEIPILPRRILSCKDAVEELGWEAVSQFLK